LRLFHSPPNTRQITPRTPVRTWWLGTACSSYRLEG
jgi:hypothetical protein